MANYSVRCGAMFHARRIAVVTWPKFLQRERTTAVSRTGKWILQEYITPTCSAATTSTKIPQQAVKKATIKSASHETYKGLWLTARESCNARTSNFSVEMINAMSPTFDAATTKSLRILKEFLFLPDTIAKYKPNFFSIEYLISFNNLIMLLSIIRRTQKD